MKYNLNYILWKEKNTKDQYPIYLRITINRQRSYVAIGYAVLKNQWDEKAEKVKASHPLSSQINADLHTRKSNLINRIVKLQMDGKTVSAVEVKAMLTSNVVSGNLFEFIDSYIDEVKGKRAGGTVINYTKNKNRLLQFHGNGNLTFDDIDMSWLSKYENHLRKEGVGNNYIHSLLKTLRAFFNAALKRGITKNYPFKFFEMPTYKSPVKDYLTLSEIMRIEDFINDSKDPTLIQTAIYFLLGCYTSLRVSDWRQFRVSEHIKGDYILLRAKKNGEWVSMPLSDALKRNLKRIEKIPLEVEDQTLNDCLKVIGKKINIKKRITTHTGRHTFAITVCAEGGVSCETCAALMGIKTSTCEENYYRVTQKKINDETRAAWARLR